MIYHILCLPTFGSPYLVATVESKKYDISEDHLKALQKAVGGYIEPIPRDSFLIHPMFCENKRWLMAKQMLSSKLVKVYVNENGIQKCVPNMATIKKTDEARRNGGCPHLFGDICLEVPEKVFQVMGFQPKSFKIVDIYEADDEEDEEAKREECASKGWEYISSGQIYEAAC